MKNYLFGFVILLFIVLIGIGIAALHEELFLKGNAAGSACTIPVITENSCPVGQSATLSQASNGCYSIVCN
jgi:hypothetical protein